MSHAGDPGSPEALLETLRVRYRASVHATLASITQLGEQLATQPDAADVIDALRREVHRLRGSAGSYGFHDLSRLAAALEDRLLQWATDASADRGDRASLVKRFAEALRRDVLGEGSDDDSAGRILLLVGLDGAQGEGVAAEAILRGFRIRRAAPDDVTPALLAEMLPRAVIVPAAVANRLPPDLAAPVVVLADADRQSAVVRINESRTGVLTVDADEPPTTLLDVVTGLASRSDHHGATVLVVDDDPTVLLIVRAIAERDGLRVVTLDSADGLVSVLEAEQPAMLLMDVQLGEVSGIEMTKVLRSSAAYRELPIVLFSGTTSADVRSAAFAAGADDFFAKPLVAAEVQQRMQERLERRRWRRLVDGWHPAIDVALPVRTAREGPRAWVAPASQSLALIHPAAGAVDGNWLREVARITTQLTPVTAAVGFLDGDVLVVIATEDAAALAAHVQALRTDDIGWHAGVVHRAAATTQWEDALSCAREALDVARRGEGAAVHTWTESDADIPPDVIIVEDDEALADMLEYALRMVGYTYRRYDEGKTALAALLALRTGAHRPIVLMDVDLPGLDGHSIHDRLRVDRPGAFVVVFVSAHASEGEQLRALNAGAWDYLTKPLNLRVLLAKLPMWMTRAAAAS